ncbi:hypothetical protein [uncultured Nocardioides sp.]|uniref:hypothetical protein n=1 Tax=uncultured Nocardioides sp. TaxID=198441 RepID=UPI0026329389|nr:hypothetical protein [uncultured Nocardioides sp.]
MSLRAFFAALAASALVVAVAVGLWTWRTGGDAGEQAEDPASAELDSRGPCPPSLPEPEDDDGYGFGSSTAAADSPGLSPQARAWTCTYQAVGRPRDSGNGTFYTWDLADGPTEVDAALLPDVVDATNALRSPPSEYGCTADLGPRTVLVLVTDDGNLTGVSIDRYGCREVRLTADPWSGAPGETPAPGVPRGVLFDGRALLDLLALEPPAADSAPQ